VKSQPVEFLELVEHDLNYARNFYDTWLTGGAVLDPRNDPRIIRSLLKLRLPRH